MCSRCKLFYKKEAEFKEKGVGTLHLKLTEQGKTQLIIRADTNLGEWAESGAGHLTYTCTQLHLLDTEQTHTCCRLM